MNFHGEKRTNDTPQSTTAREARLARKGSGHESKLAYCGNVLIDNGNGLVVDTALQEKNRRRYAHGDMLMLTSDPRYFMLGSDAY